MGADIPLDLRFFGGFALTVEGRPLGLGGGRLPALLAYLVRSGPMLRSQTAGTICANSSTSFARRGRSTSV